MAEDEEAEAEGSAMASPGSEHLKEQQQSQAPGSGVTGDAADVPMPERKSEEAEAGQALDQNNTASSADDRGRLHVSSEKFRRCPRHIVDRWLRDSTTVALQEVFKMNPWGYAFVSVKEEDVAEFCKEIEVAKFKGASITVKAGHMRKADDGSGAARSKAARETNESSTTEPVAKKRKLKDFPDGYVPTLKDLKDREKHRRRETEASVMQKSAPLYEWPYAKQLEMKGTYIKTAVKTLVKQVRARCEDEAEEMPKWTTSEWATAVQAPAGCGCPLDTPIGTALDDIEGYRNKCEFTIGVTEDGQQDCGYVLRVCNGEQVIDVVDKTPHTPEAMKRLCRVVRDLVRASPFPIYDRRLGGREGVWRLVMARLAPTGEMLVMIQVACIPEGREDELRRSIIEALSVQEIKVVSIYIQINDTPTDAARPDAPLLHIHGLEKLIMPLLGLRFEIGPLSFFQANSSTCAALYERALQWLRPKDAIVFDVCCGVGSIGLCAARHCKKVIGLELVPEAVESANSNAKLNNITNAEFHVGRAEDTLPALLRGLDGDADVCAIVDPPRPGLHNTVLQALRSCSRLSRLVYVSCNPDSLVEDVAKLVMPREGFDPFVPLRAVAVDMFPHTLHCEMIMLLERRSHLDEAEVAIEAPRRTHEKEQDKPSSPEVVQDATASS